MELETEFRTCSAKDHESPCIKSPHKKNKVPVDLFRKVPGNPHSTLNKKCLHCRDYSNKCKNAERKRKSEQETDDDHFICVSCFKTAHEENRATLDNGEKGTQCSNCYIRDHQKREQKRNALITVKLEFIEKNNASCEICRIFFFPPKDEYSGVIRIESENNHVTLNDVKYEVTEFVKLFKDKLELGILEFDHLPEDEQRRRGILKECDKYDPKYKNVTGITSIDAIRLEARKCQLVCSLCHLTETVSRKRTEKKKRGENQTKKSTKEDYRDQEKLKGCVICHYKNPQLLSFFEFDHIDPETKVDDVSKMVASGATFDEFVLEISKTRLLCRFCHRLHTNRQYHEKRQEKAKRLKIEMI